eukprot:Nk52_evm73s1737 gene=Nk52_evmTU73s1737
MGQKRLINGGSGGSSSSECSRTEESSCLLNHHLKKSDALSPERNCSGYRSEEISAAVGSVGSGYANYATDATAQEASFEKQRVLTIPPGSGDASNSLGEIKMYPTWVVALALLGVQTGFAGWSVIMKRFGGHDDKIGTSIVFSALRDPFGFLLLLAIAYWMEKGLYVPRKSEWPTFFLLGLTGCFGNQVFFLLGLKLTTPVITCMAQPSVPIFTSVIAILLCFEPMPNLKAWGGWAKIIGISMTVCGGYLMILGNEQPATSGGEEKKYPHMLLGDIFLLFNCISMALFLVLQKKLLFHAESRWHNYPLSSMAWIYFCGTVLVGIAAIFCGIQDPSSWRFPTERLYPLVYSVFVTSALCYILITFATTQVPSSVVGASWPLMAPISSVMSYLVFGETLKLVHVVGFLLIVTALWLLLFVNWWEEKSRDAKSGGRYIVVEDSTRS